MGTNYYKQYLDIKKRYSDLVILCEGKGYYVTYNDDARICANTLGITLIKDKDKRLQVTFPSPELDGFLPKLVRAGFRVGLCNELTKQN